MALFRVFLSSFHRARGGHLTTWAFPDRHVAEYYNFVAQGLARAVQSLQPRPKLRATLDYSPGPRLAHRGQWAPNILIQIEQTVVAPGAQESNAVPGKIPLIGQAGNYYARLAGEMKRFREASAIIDYAAVNVKNIKYSDLNRFTQGKHVYIAPLITRHMINESPRRRDILSILTVMSKPKAGERRAQIVEDLSRQGLRFKHVENKYRRLDQVYSRAGILLNINQTDYHHTLTELRLLPALSQGVIVISEIVPEIGSVPYSKFIFFARRNELGDVIRRVQDNYHDVWHSIFSTQDFAATMSDIHAQNLEAFRSVIKLAMI